jgi:type III pantothenate kinase
VFGCCIGRNIEKSLLEFEKEVEVHFIPMMTIFLSSIGMKHHKHWELIGWFLLAQPCSFRLNRLVIDAGTCVTFDFIDESDKYLEAQSPRVAIALQVIT